MLNDSKTTNQNFILDTSFADQLDSLFNEPGRKEKTIDYLLQIDLDKCENYKFDAKIITQEEWVRLKRIKNNITKNEIVEIYLDPKPGEVSLGMCENSVYNNSQNSDINNFMNQSLYFVWIEEKEMLVVLKHLCVSY